MSQPPKHWRMNLNNYGQGQDANVRFRYDCTKSGPGNSPIWTCKLFCNEVAFTTGVGSNKAVAMEKAAKEALRRLCYEAYSDLGGTAPPESS